jgi:6-phosphogluconolactonase (cycloisomerase 2 family)
MTPTFDLKAPASLARRHLLVGAAAAAALSACGGGGGDDDGQGFRGAVYAGTNRTMGNSVAAFGRSPDGTLVGIGDYATGGNGGSFDGTNDGLDPLISEDTIVGVDDRFLLVVNAGSNTLTSMRINADFSLSVVGSVPSGGFGPNSIAYRSGLVYVANTDSDGAFTGPPDHKGNITGFRFDTTSGSLTAIANSTRELENRPSDLEFSPGGGHLIVSSVNSGSVALAAGNNAELVVYGVQADGRLTTAATSSVTSTTRGNSAGRNLPTAIGFEAVMVGTRTFIIVSEAREFLSTGAPGMLPMFQTASVSTWELNANGTLTPRSQDVLTGPVITTGPSAPTSACWLAVAPDRTTFWVAHASGAVISSFRLNADGTIALLDGRAAVGMPAVVGPTPLATADGLVDITVSSDGQFVYQLLGLRGAVTVYRVGANGALTMTQRTTGLLPMTGLAGLVSVDRI